MLVAGGAAVPHAITGDYRATDVLRYSSILTDLHRTRLQEGENRIGEVGGANRGIS
jgi:hypothetical protein